MPLLAETRSAASTSRTVPVDRLGVYFVVGGIDTRQFQEFIEEDHPLDTEDLRWVEEILRMRHAEIPVEARAAPRE